VLCGPRRGESCPIIDSMSLAPLPLLALIRADAGSANDGHPAKAIHAALFERLFMDAQAKVALPRGELLGAVGDVQPGVPGNGATGLGFTSSRSRPGGIPDDGRWTNHGQGRARRVQPSNHRAAPQLGLANRGR
jgi:hypothetical protein